MVSQEGIQEKAVMEYLNMYSWHFPGGTEENHKKISVRVVSP
jgi:hypothetical protein